MHVLVQLAVRVWRVKGGGGAGGGGGGGSEKSFIRMLHHRVWWDEIQVVSLV